jgi:hypothetical protein
MAKMHRVMRWAAAAGLCTAAIVGRAATQEWMEKVESDRHNFPQIATWINSSCKPDSISDVKVVSYQAGRGGPISVHVYCHRGDGKMKPVVYDFWNYQGDEPALDLFTRNVLIGNDVIILMRYEGDENGIHYLH